MNINKSSFRLPLGKFFFFGNAAQPNFARSTKGIQIIHSPKRSSAKRNLPLRSYQTECPSYFTFSQGITQPSRHCFRLRCYLLTTSSKKVSKTFICPFSLNNHSSYPFGIDNQFVRIRDRCAGYNLETRTMYPAYYAMLRRLRSAT